MKTSILTTLLSALSFVLANPLPQAPSPSTLAALRAACLAGPPSAYVAVQYANTPDFVLYQYGQCYPYSINGGENLAVQAYFCRSVTCNNNPNPDCTGGAVPPVGVPLPAGTYLYNAEDFVQILGQGATCQQNQLPL